MKRINFFCHLKDNIIKAKPKKLSLVQTETDIYKPKNKNTNPEQATKRDKLGHQAHPRIKRRPRLHACKIHAK